VLPSGQKTWRYRAITSARRIPVTPARERRRVHQTSVTLNRSQLDVQTHDGEGPAGTAGDGAAAYFKEISTGGVSPGPGLIALNLPAGAYAFLARVRVRNASFGGVGEEDEAGVNCSVGVPGQLTHTETSQNRILFQGETSFVVSGVVTASSPFTAFLNCAGSHVNIESHTSMIALKIGSIVLQ
jgi:hypothetical protein